MHPLNVPSSTVVGGGHSGPTNELSPESWTSHSFLHETGHINTSAPSQHEPHEDDRPQPERSAMVMDNATVGMDLQSDAEAPSRLSSDVASAVAIVAPSVVTATNLGTVNNTEARVHNRENEGDDTLEGSKKKELVFLGGVELVDFNDCDISNRLQYDSKDIDDKEAPNREEMDIDVSAPSCIQIVGPSSSTTSAQVLPAVSIQTDPLVESFGGFSDPFFNAARKAPHPDAIIVK